MSNTKERISGQRKNELNNIADLLYGKISRYSHSQDISVDVKDREQISNETTLLLRLITAYTGVVRLAGNSEEDSNALMDFMNDDDGNLDEFF